MLDELLISLDRKANADEMMTSLVAAAAQLGFDYVGYAFVLDFPVDRPEVVLCNNYPSAWRSRREVDAHVETDPGIQHGLRSTTPHRSSTYWCHADVDIEADVGLQFGWSQSIFDGNGGVGILTLSRASLHISDDELRDKEHRMRWLVYVAHQALSRYIKSKMKKPALTRREIEILQWSAAGKTSPEIGRILKIRESTTRFHLARAIQKLGAPDKAAAVAQAVFHGLLDEVSVDDASLEASEQAAGRAASA